MVGRVRRRRALIWGPASTIAELADDPQAAATGLSRDRAPRWLVSAPVAAPMRISGADIRPRGPAPSIGGHTVRSSPALGFDPGEFDALTAANIVRRQLSV